MNLDSMYDLLDKWFDEGKKETQEYKELETAVNTIERDRQFAAYNAEEDLLWQRRSTKEERADFLDREVNSLNNTDPFFSAVIENKFVEAYYANLA
jgi:hypothetical protein